MIYYFAKIFLNLFIFINYYNENYISIIIMIIIVDLLYVLMENLKFHNLTSICCDYLYIHINIQEDKYCSVGKIQ